MGIVLDKEPDGCFRIIRWRFVSLLTGGGVVRLLPNSNVLPDDARINRGLLQSFLTYAVDSVHLPDIEYDAVEILRELRGTQEE